MATHVIPWTTGSGNITLTYTGEGDEAVLVQSDENTSTEERSQGLSIGTTAGTPSVVRTIVITQAAGTFTPVILNYDYSGAVATVKLKAGTYVLETWGAQGGNYSTFIGGFGGYSKGTLTLTESTTLYIYAGGQPATVSTSRASVPGGFNGGGNGQNRYYSNTYTYGQGGGGASDIRVGDTSLYARVIVAGGGGGSASDSSYDTGLTKYGGGASGGSGRASASAAYVAGQTAPTTNGYYLAGTFGVGAKAYTSRTNYKYGSGGGGGGWYGGFAYNYSTDNDTVFKGYNGGGSGYVYTEDTQGSYPSGCLLDSSHLLADAETLGGNVSFLAPDGNTETGHTGNGYVRITCLSGGVDSEGGDITPGEENLVLPTSAGVYIAFHYGDAAAWCEVAEWDTYRGSTLADGVLVVNGSGKHIILSPEDKVKKSLATSSGTSIGSSVGTQTAAAAYYDGKSRTQALMQMSVANTSACCAYYCTHYQHGGIAAGDWFLPSFGELCLLRDNLEQVEAALNAISGVSLLVGSTNAYLYSTTIRYGSSNKAWSILFGSIDSQTVNYPDCTSHYCRPCAYFGDYTND